MARLDRVVAFAGIGLAWFFFLRSPARGRRAWPRSAAPLHTAAAEQVLRRRALRRGDRAADRRLSRGVLWKVVDAEVIDGAVNGAGAVVETGSDAAAAAADRLGARLRGVGAARRRARCSAITSGDSARWRRSKKTNDRVSCSRLLHRRAAARRRGGSLLLVPEPRRARATALVRQLALRRLAGGLRADAAAVGAVRPRVGRVPVRRARAWIPAFGIDYHVGVDGISLCWSS